MARIRSIKPEFFTSLSNGALSRDARLLYIGLYTYCDDEGRGVHDARVLKGALFPLDDDLAHEQVALLIGELHRAGKVVLYVVDGKPLLRVTNWHHQKISHPTASRLPPEDSGKILEPSGKSQPRGRARASADQGTGNREQGTGTRTHVRSASDFDAFWEACPRKIGKTRAKAKYDAAVKRGIAPADLLAGLIRAAEGWTRDRTEERFIPHPATWIEQGRWEDQPGITNGNGTKPHHICPRAACGIDWGTPESVCCFQDACPLMKADAQ